MKTTAKLWRAGVLAALASGAFHAQAAATLVAGWDFEKVEADGITIKSKVGTYAGEIAGSAVLTDAGGGRPGAGGGRGFSIGLANPGWLLLAAGGLGEGDANPMTAAAVDDSMTVVLWEKNDSNINSSSFWAIGPGFDRAFQFHIPWSDGTIYFDTAGGCCAAPTQRLNANVVNVFPEHDWLGWHHYAFVKDLGYKAVYVDGNLLISQDDGAAPLPTEYTQLSIGAANNASPPDGIIDDVAIYKGALTEAEIKALAAGGSPFTPPVDTDNDGMPDEWEIANGFNPNDPSDAPKDFDNDGVTNLDEYKAGTNPIDTTPPTIVSAAGTGSFDTVVVTFSESVDPVTGADKAKYSIDPPLTISAAAVKKNTVTLTTAAQTPGATKYTVTVNGVLDTSKNSVAANSSVVFYSYLATKDGVLRFAYWGGIGGNPVQNLYDDPRYPATPDEVHAVFQFNSRDAFPNDSHEAYGALIEGYVTPTETGSYRFFLASDDASQLFVSTDDKEANLEQVAEQTGCCNAFMEPDSAFTSEPRALTAGRKYYIRGVYKEGGGGDWLSVAWRKEGDPTPAASLPTIPGKFLSAAVDLPAPPQGAFVTQIPAPGAKNVSPATGITIAHRDGKTAWTAENTSLKINDVAVAPSTFTKEGLIATYNVPSSALYPSASVQKVTLGYLDAGGNPATLEYMFTVAAYSGPTKDKVAAYPGLIMGSAVYTADAGGHTATAGDYGIDLTTKGGPVATFDAGFLAAANAATANDELSVTFWQKKYDVADSSAFTLHSPSAGNNRNFHAHVPWSNQHIYFDTVGCCDLATQRIEAGIDTYPDYNPPDATFWTASWHFFAFTKKGSVKNIYVDGNLFLAGDSTNPLRTDSSAFYMGSGAGGAELSHAIIDDFGVYGKELTQANVTALKNGTKPNALPAAVGLIAYWDFNDKSVAAPTISIAPGAAGKIVVTFTGTLQSSTTVGSGYANVAGASPLTLDATGAALFLRSVQ